MKNSTFLSKSSYFFIYILILISLPSRAQQVARGLTASNGVYIGFYEYTPTTYSANPTEKYPIIIFLHGIGERGDGIAELPNVLGQGIPKYIYNGNPMRFYWNGKWETFLVLSPQLSRNYGNWQNFYVDEMLAYAKQNLRIDTNRIYLTGLSLGGGGVWSYASSSLTNAKKFAAIAPVCGTCAISNACNLANANLPVWAFHAQDDGIVGAGCTTSSIQGINNCNPAVKPLMTMYSNGGHFIWDRAFDTVYNWQNPNLYEWFLGQNKSLPVNTAPTANAGADITITLPVTSTAISSVGSNDPDGTIVRYLWRKISGPSSGVIQTPNSATTNINGLVQQGVYQFELLVADNRAAFKLDTVQVTVNSGPPGTNIPPFAMAGYDVTINVDQVNLDSWGSTDVDGAIVSYLWTKVSGPTTYTMPYNMYGSCGITGMVSGVYQFELKVTDNMGGIGKDTVQVTVNLPGIPPTNQAPNANAGADIFLSLPGNSTTVNGSASFDPDGSIVSFTWSKISGPAQYLIGNPNTASTSLTNLVAGIYTFRLAITDNNGATDSDTIVVTVATAPPANQIPIANAGSDISIILPVNNVTVNGAGSYDPDGSITSFSWSKINGPAQYTIVTPTLTSTAINNLVAGSYAFQLVVTDNNGATDLDTIIVTINSAPPPPNIVPIAKAGADIAITLPANNGTLNGFDSYDPDGIITNFSWSKISGPAQYSITSPNNGITTITGLAQGVYKFQLNIMDNNGATSSDTVSVTVSSAPPPPNQLPIAIAGADIAITLPANNASLSGLSSYDPDGSIVSYNWVKIAGPSQFTLVNSNAVSTTVNNLAQGTYSFRLVVTDNNGAIDSDTLSIQVTPAPPPPNQAPNAVAGGNTSITLPTNNTTLNGSASSDPDGSIISYTWTKISGPATYTIANAAGASTALSNLVQGTYSFRLVVTDNSGASDSDTVSVTVNPAALPPNLAPVANAGNDVTILLPVNYTTLSGNGSNDPDGTIATYNWSKISGPAQFTITNASISTPSITNLIAGTYSFRLDVTDNTGAGASDTVLVIVQAAIPPPNQGPNANAGTDFSVNLPNPSIYLNGSASNDPDGSIVAYSWVKISGSGAVTIVNSTTALPSVFGVQAAEYIFELTVTDNSGATSKDQVKITVNSSTNNKPVANAGNDTTISVPASAILLNGSLSYDNDGSIVSYGWKQVNGPSLASLSNLSGATTTLSNLVAGEYRLELTVTDNSGVIDKDTVRITVINNLRYQEKLTLYPNPAMGIMTVSCVSDSTGQAKITIYDQNGIMLQSTMFVKSLPFQERQVDVTRLKSGVYFLEVIINKNKKMIARFIRQ